MEHKVFFKNTLGQTLAGVLSLPDGEGPFNAVINCHGFTATKDMHYHPQLSEELAKSGIITLRFDFTGNGESEGEFSEGDFEQQVRDISSAIDFLKTQKVLRIGLAAHSMGGAVGIVSAATDKRIKSLALISPGVSFNKYIFLKLWKFIPQLFLFGKCTLKRKDDQGKVKEYVITRKYANSRKKFNLFKIIKLIKQPKLICYGSKDGPSSRPKDMKKLFESAIFPKKIVEIKGAEHNYPIHSKELVKNVVDFFKETLK